MLLRIDAYPAEAPSHQRPQPLYACLATSASGTDDADMAGRLLTIGRKTGHVVFGGDKSVSREHCILRLVSANKTHQQHVVGISNTRIPPPMKPRNPEEIKACDNDLQMCVVLENIGKVGSFVVQERVPTLNDSNDKNDNSDTDDDTDEEANTGVAASASQQMLGVQLSPAARALIPDPSTVTLKYVGPGESIVLEKLSSNNKNDKPVIVQCGKMGSTIVVQRQHIRIIRSGEAEKRLKADWRARLHCVGVQETTTLDESTTHLLTAVRDTTSKQLAAWCWGLPIVTSNYLQALWERTSPASPLPDPADAEPGQDGQQFWYAPANRQLLLGATYLSCNADDMELLVRAAGAAIVPLYGLTQAEALAKADEHLHSDERDSEPDYSCFALSDDKSRRKLPRLLKERGVPQVSGKSIATSITEQNPLHDTKGNRIGKPTSASTRDTAGKKAAPKGSNEHDEVAKETQEPEPAPTRPSRKQTVEVDAEEDDEFPVPDDDDNYHEEPASGSQSQDRRSQGKHTNNSAGSLRPNEQITPASLGVDGDRRSQSKERVLEVERSQDRDTSRPTSKTRGSSTADTDADGDTRSPKRKHQALETEAVEEKEPDSLPAKKSKTRGVSTADTDADGDTHSPKRKRQIPEMETAKEKEPDSFPAKKSATSMHNGNDNDDDGRPSKRKKLESKGNGWVVAAPKGKKRRAFISSKDEILEATGYLPLVAPTDTDKSMVLAPMQQHQIARFSSRSSRTEDFKGFRKNSVVRPPGHSRIQMRSVLPRVPEKQSGQFEEQQRALEEQQQKADELFRDARRTAASSSRRRG
jgi:pSer/pThr/pTyr-binding forkhead associated (FHA) protein